MGYDLSAIHNKLHSNLCYFYLVKISNSYNLGFDSRNSFWLNLNTDETILFWTVLGWVIRSSNHFPQALQYRQVQRNYCG